MSKREILLEALVSTPNDLRLTVSGLGETAVFYRPTPDEWSVADVVYHLQQVEGRYLARLERVVREERPSLPYIHPEEKAEPDRNFAQLMAGFQQARQQTVAFLQTLTPGQWQRKGKHETWGEVNLRYLVQQLVAHDIEHLNQIVQIMGKVKREEGGARSEEGKLSIVNRKS